MRIGELARRSGASTRSIRHYESVGLLSSSRTSNGYREFDESAPERVARIKLLLRVGLDIADVVAVLPCLSSPGMSRCEHARRRYDRQIERIERQQELLEQARSLLLTIRDQPTSEPVMPPGSGVQAVSANVTVGVP